MELLIGASLVAAFIAGVAALFAPCCITVLLPAYLGSIFRQKRTVFLMTFVFFLGLLAVFLPLGLGFAGLGQLFSQYHDIIFSLGSIFLVFLGIFILLGRHFALPFSANPKLNVQNAGSVFVLGIFSGFATICCAPVLAGVLALSVLPGSIFWGGIYSLAYVLGMVSPLFIIAYFIDKKDLTGKIDALNKQISYDFAGRSINITLADVISGITFVLMGLLIFYLEKTGQLAMNGGGYMTDINIYMANITSAINRFLGTSPAFIWVLLLILGLYLIVRTALKSK